MRYYFPNLKINSSPQGIVFILVGSKTKSRKKKMHILIAEKKGQKKGRYFNYDLHNISNNYTMRFQT